MSRAEVQLRFWQNIEWRSGGKTRGKTKGETERAGALSQLLCFSAALSFSLLKLCKCIAPL